LVALPIKFLTPAVDLLWNAWDTFDHPLQKQFDSEMREALRHVDDPEDHNGRDLAERLRKRLALRHDHWLVAADVRVAGIAAARAVPEDGTLASGRKPARRTAKYEAINSALCEIAKAMPEDHEEVFQFLDSRTVPIPNRDPFKTEKGWLKGFERDRPAARSWLSRTWSSLGLSPFARGPKKK
jgi:hypothetical protein